MNRQKLFRIVIYALPIMATIFSTPALRAQGITLTGVGPVNRSMGGAGTAAPLDAIGALHWNPGSICALASNELGFGVELLNADIRLSNGGATTSGDAGWSAIPSIGWVHHVNDTVTVGLGVYGVAGFKNNLPNDPTNPIFLVLGGPGFASAEILQIAPTLSLQITERLSVGFSPTITTETLTFDPLGPPVTPVLTLGQGNRMHWGGGFQAGAYYRGLSGFNTGFTFKSTQWIEDLNFFTPTGTAHLKLDYPMIVSLGLSYTGLQDWVFAIDGRYFDYENTDGYREFGWRSVFASAIGAQYRVSEKLTTRVGYNCNQNPIQSGQVFANLLSPLIQDQNIAMGGTYQFTRNVGMNAGYVYLINNSLTGPSPLGPIQHEIQAHSIMVGISVRY